MLANDDLVVLLYCVAGDAERLREEVLDSFGPSGPQRTAAEPRWTESGVYEHVHTI
jgi:hypothetical protein